MIRFRSINPIHVFINNVRKSIGTDFVNMKYILRSYKNTIINTKKLKIRIINTEKLKCTINIKFNNKFKLS